jgi:progressive ankylosis protein
MTTPENIPRIFRFWLPLQATWLMMAVEGPFLAAIIARLAEPKINLAAYGVAFSLAIMVEAPVIMMMSAATALVDSPGSYRKLRNFNLFLNVGITVFMLLMLFTPMWGVVTGKWMRLDPQVAKLTHMSLVILLPWPAAIGFRRFYQGLLIRSGKTRLVAWGTLLRLFSMSACAVILWQTTELPGSWIGASALTAGVCAELLASRVMAHQTIREILAGVSGNVLGYAAIIRFYYPLALTSTISLVVHPMVTFFMGQSRYPLESLAVLPVINSLVFIFRTPGLSFQEVAITVLGRSWDDKPLINRFALLLGAGAVTGMGLIALTPLAKLWFTGLSGLSPELMGFALPPAKILVLMPGLSVLLSYQRALLVARRDTGFITWASVLEVLGILGTLFVTIHLGHWTGATAAATAFMVGRILGNISLIPKMKIDN